LITFKLDGTRLAFISCHLTAHEGVEHCEERNTSIVEILGGVRAGDKNIDITEQFHHVFWMGDMNYRLTFDPRTPKNVKKNIDASVASKRQVARTTSKMEDIKVELNDDTKGGAEKDAMDDDESSDEDEDAGASSGDKKKEW
jgi:phosphatidylinositol-3,4,5-trisphosphate 5-phosphatase 2